MTAYSCCLYTHEWMYLCTATLISTSWI
jgi:hypothetical protein